MDNINKKICKSDSDCDNNYLCAFDENDLNHYCISNDKNDSYYGCLNNKDNNFNYIESNILDDKLSYNNCINFTRKQTTKDGLHYNYMLFKPKKNLFVDTTTLNIYLKCEDEILSVIPYNDYFNLKCNNDQEECVLESKDSLLNFIIQNSKNCTKKIYIEITHECENEGLKKIQKIPINIDNYKNIKIDLKCPVDDNNDKFKSKCMAAYFQNNNNLNTNQYTEKNMVNLKKSLYDCDSPLYKVPRIVNDSNKYKKLKDNLTKNEIKEYDNKINKSIEDLKKLKAEKYIILNKIQTGTTITLDEAFKKIDKISPSKLLKNENDNWKLYKDYDAAQYLFNENNNERKREDNILIYYGKVYTIEEAIKVANENNQSFFVWYHNSYELDNFASKLYFINIYAIENDIFDKSNWAINENVTTGILKFEEFGIFDKVSNTVNKTVNNFAGEIANLKGNLDNERRTISNLRNVIKENEKKLESVIEENKKKLQAVIEEDKKILNDLIEKNAKHLQYVIDNDQEKFDDFKKLMKTSIENTALIKDQYITALDNNISNDNINGNIITTLDDKITTYGQAINMNNYEYNMYNNILVVLGFIFGIILSIFIVILVYYVNILSQRNT
jgi:hypothetical protein